ncbi:MAG: peroxiredoxin, partial [Pseudomonadota bacterium]
MNTPVLPDNLPEPLDDGACAHLEGMAFPAVALASTDGPVTLAQQPGTVVVYLYPRSSPDHDDPDGWDAIPGARGCSPQGCAFRDHQAELAAHGARVFG